MSKQFDAAIQILDEAITRSHLREELCSPERWQESMDSCRAAIRLLEAAGEVDKARVKSLLDGSDLHHQGYRTAADGPIYVIDEDAKASLYGLVEALPDEEKP